MANQEVLVDDEKLPGASAREKALAWLCGLAATVTVVLATLQGGAKLGLTALTIVGAALTIGGLAWGGKRLRQERADLVSNMGCVSQIQTDEALAAEERNSLTAKLIRLGTFGDITMFHPWIRRYILDHALGALGVPLALTLLGVAASTGASVWSLWLPTDQPAKAPTEQRLVCVIQTLPKDSLPTRLICHPEG